MVAVRFLFWVALAFICESMTEYIFSPLFVNAPAKWKWIDDYEPIKYVALAVGIGLAVSYKLDIIYETFGATAAWPQVGVVVTGLTIGRGSNYVNSFYERYIKKPEAPPTVTLVGNLTSTQTATTLREQK